LRSQHARFALGTVNGPTLGKAHGGRKMISEHEFHAHWGIQLSASGDLLTYEDIRGSSVRHVWTIVESGSDDDGNWYAVPGFHYVNRLGYVLTARAWSDGTRDAIYFLDDL
jgi:hypothetical protein